MAPPAIGEVFGKVVMMKANPARTVAKAFPITAGAEAILGKAWRPLRDAVQGTLASNVGSSRTSVGYHRRDALDIFFVCCPSGLGLCKPCPAHAMHVPAERTLRIHFILTID